MNEKTDNYVMDANHHQNIEDVEATYWWHCARRHIILRLCQRYLFQRGQNVERLIDFGSATGYTGFFLKNEIRRLTGHVASVA